jgi:long-subunit fatty acid transport protein
MYFIGKIMKKILAVVISVFLLGTNNNLTAGDVSLRSISHARTSSLNGLYIAGFDEMNNAFNNVAGLSYLNSSFVEMSLVDLIGQSELDNPTNGLYRSFQQDNVALSAGIFYPISEKIVVGLSYQRAYDYNLNWPFAVLTSTDRSSVLQTFDLLNNINIDAILPSVAFRFGSLSIGASLNIFNVNYKSAFPVTNFDWNDTLGLPAYQMEYDMDAWSFGFNVGMMYDATGDLRIGAFVRSSFSADLEGSVKSDLLSSLDSVSAQSDVTTTFEYPWVFGLGMLYNISADWIVNLDFQYSLFGSSSTVLDMNYSDPGWNTKNFQSDPLTGINPSNILLAFDDAFDAGVGIEYLVIDWSFRGGYRFSQSQNTDASYNFLFPTVDQHWISLGLGYNDSIYFVDLTAAYAFGADTEIISMPSVSGKYDSQTVNVSIALKYAF